MQADPLLPAGGKWWRLKYRFDGKEKRIHAESLALREIAPKYGSEAAKAVYAHLQNRRAQS